MKVVIHAGHNPDGKIACGAVGILKESTVNRMIVDHLGKILREYGAEVHDVTVNDGKNQKEILNRLAAETNRINPDLSVSVHCNSHFSESASGTEVYYYRGDEYGRKLANRISAGVSGRMGIRDRGSIPNTGLAVLTKIKAHAILIETFFVSSPKDCGAFERVGEENIAREIALAIMEINSPESSDDPEPEDEVTTPNPEITYQVICGSFKDPYNAIRESERMDAKNIDCWIKNDGGVYRLVCGVFKHRENAEILCNTFRASGFSDAWIREVKS